MKPVCDVERVSSALRAWADLISSGYVVPAAGMCMLEAADLLISLNTHENPQLSTENILYKNTEWVPIEAYREAMDGWKSALKQKDD